MSSGGASYRNQRAPGTLGQDVDVVGGEVKRDFDINPYSYATNTSRVLDPREYYTANYAPFNIFNELEITTSTWMYLTQSSKLSCASSLSEVWS